MKPERCPTCKMRIKRSSEANRRYWALLHLIAEKLQPKGVAYSADTWHTYFKSKFLGCEDVTLPNGQTLTIPHSSAGLDIGEFSDFMTQVESWANERKVYLEDEVLT